LEPVPLRLPFAADALRAVGILNNFDVDAVDCDSESSASECSGSAVCIADPGETVCCSSNGSAMTIAWASYAPFSEAVSAPRTSAREDCIGFLSSRNFGSLCNELQAVDSDQEGVLRAPTPRRAGAILPCSFLPGKML
jgi:hypothetical protein